MCGDFALLVELNLKHNARTCLSISFVSIYVPRIERTDLCPAAHCFFISSVWFSLSHVICTAAVEFCSRTLLVRMRSHAVKCIQVCSFFVALWILFRWFQFSPSSSSINSTRFNGSVMIIFIDYVHSVCVHIDIQWALVKYRTNISGKKCKTIIAQCKVPIGFSNRTHQKNIGQEILLHIVMQIEWICAHPRQTCKMLSFSLVLTLGRSRYLKCMKHTHTRAQAQNISCCVFAFLKHKKPKNA